MEFMAGYYGRLSAFWSGLVKLKSIVELGFRENFGNGTTIQFGLIGDRRNVFYAVYTLIYLQMLWTLM